MTEIKNVELNNSSNTNKVFDEQHLLHQLKQYLPTQTPLKDFIHHNSLHAFQEMKFYDAIFKASKIFGFQVTLELNDYRKLLALGRIKKNVLDKIILQKKGEKLADEWQNKVLNLDFDECKTQRAGRLRSYWKTNYDIEMDNMVQPLLFRILVSYLDQGISLWNFPTECNGFLDSIRELEKNSFTSFFKTKRAKELLMSSSCEINNLLDLLVGDEAYYEQYIFDQQFSHRGWSGMVATLEQRPDTLLDSKTISLRDAIIFELLLEIDALDYEFGTSWNPLCKLINTPPQNIFADIENNELNEVFSIWQDAFEWSYYDEVLAGITVAGQSKDSEKSLPGFQALFCIDERECSIRMHIEQVDPTCETFGTPGFFGVEFYFQPEYAKFYDKLCPAPVTPKYLIKEYEVEDEREHDSLYTRQSHGLWFGAINSLTHGFLSAIRMPLNLFRPRMSPAISNAFTHMTKNSKLAIENKNSDDIENGLQVGFTIEEMTNRVESVLRGIGLTTNFSSLVYVIGHGSSSANNPHHGAHDCGACSGRPGSVNARVFAFMANHPKVREVLKERGISIPDETQFIGCLHDTAADEMEYYDTEILTEINTKQHVQNSHNFESALDLNAKERSRRFASINTRKDISKVRKAIKNRSVSLFEPRPELGHGTNSLCIIGNRSMTKNLFLDRRAFLNSYDYKSDIEGKLLAGIMGPVGPVCGGINLEYYFSRMDNHKLGAGTKLPHNVMGLIGVANSCDGDLRPGLPLQMIEVHDPVRLLVIVEHYPEVVLKTIQSTPQMYEWYANEWIHIIAIHPLTRSYYYFKQGVLSEYIPLNKDIKTTSDINAILASAMEMETNYIVDATQENLPVYSLN